MSSSNSSGHSANKSDPDWKKPEKYVPSGPGAPLLPPQLSDFKYKNVDDFVTDLKKMPFFMTELDDVNDEDNAELEALKAMSYEGKPHEIADNFKTQGNDCYKVKKYKDAVDYYTQAITVQIEGSIDKKFDSEEERKVEADLLKTVQIAAYSNRAACNLELKNYRRCINDCKSALLLDPAHNKSTFRAGKAYLATDHIGEAAQIVQYGQNLLQEAIKEGKQPAKAAQIAQAAAFESLLSDISKRQKTLDTLEAKRKAVAELKFTKARNLQAAVDAHNFTNLIAADRNTGATKPDLLEMTLEDPLNPASELSIPLLVFYPLEMDSDCIKAAQIDIPISDFLNTIFESPPPWFSKSPTHARDYAIGNMVVFAKTRQGGLVKVGLKSTLEKIYSLKSPMIPLVDGSANLYVVPKNRTHEVLDDWDKEGSRKYFDEKFVVAT